MTKHIQENSFYLVGKMVDIRLYLASIADKNITVYDYIKQEAHAYRASLN